MTPYHIIYSPYQNLCSNSKVHNYNGILSTGINIYLCLSVSNVLNLNLIGLGFGLAISFPPLSRWEQLGEHPAKWK